MKLNCKNKIPLSFLLFLATLSLVGQNLIRKPYLQTVWKDSVSVIWKTDTTVKNCELKYYYVEKKK